jgi:hypothetical protein
LALDVRTTLLENVVALHLLNRFGSNDAVYFYNHGVEVDFYVPETEVAVQVCYTVQDEATLQREVNALVAVQGRLSCRSNIIVTYEDEAVIERGGITIDVVPAYKFLLRLGRAGGAEEVC